jgi:signal transduction histidine kinase
MEIRRLPIDVNLTLLVMESVIIVGLTGGLMYAGYWFHRRDFSTEDQWWGAFWTMTGSVGIVAVVLVVNAHQLAEGLRITPQLLAEEILLGGAGGGLGGLLIGVGMAQSRRRAERIANQRDVFEFLNKLLRHNILNSATVIKGMTEHVQNDLPDTHGEKLETIQRRNASIAELTQKVRHISRTMSNDVDTESIELSSVLRQEVETARSSFEDASFETSIPDEAFVKANKALGSVFDNLLTNAVVHNDNEHPRVRISVESGDNVTRIHVSDNGPGIPADTRDTIFEPKESADSGMGLYLVDQLVTGYGGSVDTEPNDPHGTVFEVVLPLEDD